MPVDLYKFGLSNAAARRLRKGAICWVMFNYAPDGVYFGLRVIHTITDSHIAFQKIHPAGTVRTMELQVPRALDWENYGEEFIVFKEEASAKLVYTWLKYGM